MESRDSSSLSTSINRETTTNEYCVISSASVLAKDAALLFKSQKFAECFDVLDQISQKQQHDPKVLHNSAITEYLRDGCVDPHKLLEVLNNVKQRSQKITQASSEKLEDVPDAGNKFVSNVKGINFMEPPQVSGSSTIVYRDDCDSFIAILNMATIWFHLHEYRKALSFLEPLFQNIEPIDEKTALHICLLLLDVTLACNDAHKAAEVIIYMEKAFGMTAPQPTDPPPAAPHLPPQPSLQTPKPFPPPPLQTAAALPPPDALDPALTPERDVPDDALSYDTLLSTLDSVMGGGGGSGGHHLPRAAPIPPTADPPKRPIPFADLRLMLHLYRVRLLLLARNLKAAKREVKLTMNVARGSSSSSSAALILKSQLEYSRGNHRKAVKLLTASGGKPAAGEVVVNNNLGCIYYQLGKPHTSSLFFSRSLLLLTSSPRKAKASVFSEDTSRQLLYNCGIQHLACAKPQLAAACFRKSVPLFSDRPLFWLRMAECCLMAAADRGGSLRVLGRGASRQLAVGGPSPAASPPLPDLSMETARECLLNALHLLRRPPERRRRRPPLSGDTLLQSSIAEHESSCRREEGRTRQAVLANLSYVELELGNPAAALAQAALLLSLSDRSKVYDFLGRVYAAEALCLLSRHEEAGEQLRPYLTEEEEGVRPPFSQQEWEQWRAGGDGPEAEAVRPEEARGILYVDLAVMYAARGEAEKAGFFISKAPAAVLRRYPEVMVVEVYVDLMMEKKEEALQKLRCGKRVVFLPQDGVL